MQSKFVSTMQFSSFSTLGLVVRRADIESRLLPLNWQPVKDPAPAKHNSKFCLTTTMKALKGINNIASIVENARRRSLAKEEKENKKRDSFCKGDSRRGSLVKNGSRRESLILGFESEAILQPGKRRKSLKFAAGATFTSLMGKTRKKL